MVKLTTQLLHRVELGQAHKDNSAPVNALDFSSNGEWLITSSDDESLHLYQCATGVLKKTIFSKKYGASLVRFTHHPNAVVMASLNTMGDDTIRYLSLHDNKYLRYFKGHRGRVVALEQNPLDDTFLSASLDNTVRLWDLRSSSGAGLLKVTPPPAAASAASASASESKDSKTNGSTAKQRTGRPCVGYDPSGLVFGVATAPNDVRLYDARSYDKGPFATFHIQGDAFDWTGLRFSPDGKHLLLPTSGSAHVLLDAFDGKLKQLYTSHTNDSGLTLDATFSPDAQFVLSGSEDGSLHVWETLTAKRAVMWRGGHPGPTARVAWNPTKMLVASACTQLGLWIPAPEASKILLSSAAAAGASSSSSSAASASSSGAAMSGTTASGTAPPPPYNPNSYPSAPGGYPSYGGSSGYGGYSKGK